MAKRPKNVGGTPPVYGPVAGPRFGGAATPPKKEPAFPADVKEGNDFSRCVAAMRMLGLKTIHKAGRVLVDNRPKFYVDKPTSGCARFTDGTHVFEVSFGSLRIWNGYDGTPGKAKVVSMNEVISELNLAIKANSRETFQAAFSKLTSGAR